MILIAENCDGSYLPMGELATFAEAREIAASYMKNATENDFCPESFAIWGRNSDGYFTVIERFEP